MQSHSCVAILHKRERTNICRNLMTIANVSFNHLETFEVCYQLEFDKKYAG